ncbi:hypothetical protein J6590_049050 [Homalodisca vitripennis]|nr:hypothetical protein J6590_049050 [Homalodisca vitripennis]
MESSDMADRWRIGTVQHSPHHVPATKALPTDLLSTEFLMLSFLSILIVACAAFGIAHPSEFQFTEYTSRPRRQLVWILALQGRVIREHTSFALSTFMLVPFILDAVLQPHLAQPQKHGMHHCLICHSLQQGHQWLMVFIFRLVRKE